MYPIIRRLDAHELDATVQTVLAVTAYCTGIDNATLAAYHADTERDCHAEPYCNLTVALTLHAIAYEVGRRQHAGLMP